MLAGQLGQPAPPVRGTGGRKRAWHHGETMGFRSVVERFPEDGVTFILLANRADIDLKLLGLEIAEIQLDHRWRGG